jgi:geranylgeranyl reductase family protein
MWDVIVVGCGPAGAIAAHELARRSLRVLMLDKAKLPRYKTCGGGLVQRTILAIPFAIDTIVERKISSIRLSNNLQNPLVINRAEPTVFMTMRSELDSFLTEKAIEQGAELMDQQTVTEVREMGDGVLCKTNLQSFHCRYLIGADGANSVVSRQLGFPPARCGVALEVEVHLAKNLEEHCNQIDFDFNILPEGYGWVFPKADHLSCGVFTMHRNFPQIRKHYHRYILRKEFARDISKSDLSGHLIPLGPVTNKLHTHRAMLVGDAAGLADPLTGEGISFAVRSGMMAANAILESPHDLGQYSAQLERTMMAEIRVAGWAARFLYAAPSFFYNRISHKPFFAESILNLFSGKATYRELATRAFKKPHRLFFGTTDEHR